LNKERDKTDAKKKSPSTLYGEISKIDEIVDRVILKNKEKLDRIRSKEINIEKFSLKNKEGNVLYYLKRKSSKKTKDDTDSEKKRKSSKKTKDDTDSEILSEKIISEARENLGEEPLEAEEKIKEFDAIPEEDTIKKHKKRIKFGKKDKKIDDEDSTPPPTTEDLIESKDFDEVVTEIDKILKDEKPDQIDEDKEIIDKKIMETPKIEESSPKEDAAEAKAAELAEKHDFFEEKKAKKTQDKKDKDWLSSSTDDLAELKKKYSGKLTISEADLVKTDELSKDEAKLLDDKIEEIPIVKDADEKEIKIGKEDIGVPKVKKSFFRRKKPSDDKAVDLEQKKIEPDKLTSKPTFRVENLPKSDFDKDEAKLVDEDKAEARALKLAKEHLKDTDQKEKIDKEGIGASEVKKSFFKKEKPSDDKADDFEQEETESDELMSKPVFRVENLPASGELDKDEKDMLDERIKEDSSRIVDLTGEADKGEAKALKLAKEHLKDKPKPTTEKEPSVEKKAKTDIEIPTGIPLTEGDADHEHVFFDEEEPSFKGWSPQITEKEKKKMTLPPESQGEIDIDDLKSAGDIELPKEVLKTKSVKLSDLGFSEKEWEELDFYSLYEPFAYVEILREKESLDKCYFLVEIALNEEEEKLLGFIKDTLSSLDIDTFELEEKSEDEYLLDRLNQVIDEYDVDINEASRNKIFYYLGKTSLGLGKIDPLMKDPHIEDISCDGSDVPVFLYHRKYGSLKSNIRFDDEDELSSFVFKLAQKCGKHISIAEPMLDATMPDGSRIQMTLSDEITAKGSTFTIRKFRADPFSPPDLVEFNTMSSEIIAYMWLAVENGINTLFAGGTASGKTTALNALSLFIPRESKIVSIEETREINLPHPNWIPGVARSGFGEVVADKVVGEIDMYDLMKAALRQRPEYIIVGEIRGREAYVLFQAMATGHATYSTAHADSAQSLIHRLEGKPINIPRIMLQSLDIVCLHVITRVKNIRARRCKQVIEVIDIDPTTKEILTNEVFRWDPVEDKFIYSGKSYVLERVRAEKDLTREEMTNELKNRKKIVEWMNENNVREFREVSNIVARYAEDPGETLKQIEKDAKK